MSLPPLSDWTRVAIVPADLQAMRRCRRAAETVLRQSGIGDEAFAELQVALSEAVLDAVKFGAIDPDDRITVLGHWDERTLYVAVSVPRLGWILDVADVGRVVSLDAWPDRRHPPRIGLHLMRAMVDEATIAQVDGVSMLMLEKRLS